MPTLCHTFETLATRTWVYLRAAEQTEVRIGEETLTDINLIDIQDRHPAEVSTRKFTKAQEAANGADWEWWFIGGGRCLGVRLQAKKLYPDRGYTSLYGTSARAQSTRLLARAARDGIATLYCFYNWTNPEDRRDWPRLDPSTAIEQMGCGLASAHAIERAVAARRESPTVDALGACQVPWRELVCDQGAGAGAGRGRGGGEDPNESGGGRSWIERVHANLAGLLREDRSPEPRLISEPELPGYVKWVRAQEGPPYRKKVPAKRVVVFDGDA